VIPTDSGLEFPAAFGFGAIFLRQSVQAQPLGSGLSTFPEALGVMGGAQLANLTAYRAAFAVAAVICLCALPFSMSIRDADAASTIPGRSRPPAPESRPAPRAAA